MLADQSSARAPPRRRRPRPQHRQPPAPHPPPRPRPRPQQRHVSPGHTHTASQARGRTAFAVVLSVLPVGARGTFGRCVWTPTLHSLCCDVPEEFAIADLFPGREDSIEGCQQLATTILKKCLGAGDRNTECLRRWIALLGARTQERVWLCCEPCARAVRLFLGRNTICMVRAMRVSPAHPHSPPGVNVPAVRPPTPLTQPRLAVA